MNEDLIQGKNNGITDKVIDYIVSGIHSGKFVPGQRIVESDITDKLRISRASLREALKVLDAVGVITINMHRGACISVMDEKGILDFLEVLEPLMILSVTLASKAEISPTDAKALRDTVSLIETRSRDRDFGSHIKARVDFYRKVVMIGCNSELSRIIPLSRFGIYQTHLSFIQSDKQLQRVVKIYRPLCEAIISGDTKKAVGISRKSAQLIRSLFTDQETKVDRDSKFLLGSKPSQ